jgi:Acyl dehydratase
MQQRIINGFISIHQKLVKNRPSKQLLFMGILLCRSIPKLRGLVDPATPVFPGTKNIINYGINKLRFPGPVISGSSIRANCTLVSVEEVKGSIELVEEYSVEVKDQDRPACVAECIMRLYF